jgi:hypothetical protein
VQPGGVVPVVVADDLPLMASVSTVLVDSRRHRRVRPRHGADGFGDAGLEKFGGARQLIATCCWESTPGLAHGLDLKHEHDQWFAGAKALA